MVFRQLAPDAGRSGVGSMQRARPTVVGSDMNPRWKNTPGPAHATRASYDAGRNEILGRVASRSRAYLAAAGVLVVMLVAGWIIVRELDRPMRAPAQTDSLQGHTSPLGGMNLPRNAAALKQLLEPSAMQERKAAIKSTLNSVIQGKLDAGTHQMMKQFPEYNRCQSCIEDCERYLKSSNEIPLQECRRNCLRTCSERTRKALEW